MSRCFTLSALAWAILLPLPQRAGAIDYVAPPLAAKYCSACHLVPEPDAITQEHWPEIFGLMEPWIHERNLPFDAAEYAELLKNYQANSPRFFHPIPDDLAECRLGFRFAPVGRKDTTDRPIITNVNITDLDQDGKADVLVCDEVAGTVSWLVIRDGKWNEKILAEFETPGRTAVLDFNGDGHLDIAVAALGFVDPTDEPIGSAWLLINNGDQTFERQLLLGDVARVSDVKPGDFNGDGKTDFAVAQFGWRKTGGLVWLEQVTPTRFSRKDILPTNGVLQVETRDYDGDGDLDIVALISQEHERIVLLRNDGTGTFESTVLYQSPHPAYGSSGFQMVDLDQDGDLDILSTNGDMMDEVSLAKPYHGVRWLENIEGEFLVRELAAVPGCYRAIAHDMNRDGHLDIVVSSFNFNWQQADYPSLLWLENDGNQEFTTRRIFYSPSNLATMDVGDLNHDGIPDIIVGGAHLVGPLGRVARLTAAFGTGMTKEKTPESAE